MIGDWLFGPTRISKRGTQGIGPCERLISGAVGTKVPSKRYSRHITVFCVSSYYFRARESPFDVNAWNVNRHGDEGGPMLAKILMISSVWLLLALIVGLLWGSFISGAREEPEPILRRF